MWYESNNNLKMTEGDWGVELPVTVSNVEFAANDFLKFVFKDKLNGETILEKEYTPNHGRVVLMLTETETALFPVGNYVYSLDWYQAGAFLCNLIPFSSFKVVEKA